jgi:2-polyprenyl-3-methyl-5-hydroxy-6-metoxy-1,4-benzoquinol methylase
VSMEEHFRRLENLYREAAAGSGPPTISEFLNQRTPRVAQASHQAKRDSKRVSEHYVIRGGVAGRERLKILARVMHESTAALFERLGVGEEMICLDVGCGGGDVSFELARRVAPRGKVVGVDIDETKLDLAKQEAEVRGICNAEFRLCDIRTDDVGSVFDLVYARFLLTHLDDPASVVASFHKHLRPGGLVIVEDVDVSGCFTYPESKAFLRFRELYSAAVSSRGGDPDIGPRLPLLLADAGFEEVEMDIVQPAGTRGDVKLLSPITLENIADAVLQDRLASREEIDTLLYELYEFAENPRTVAGLPRVVRTWGRRPAA